MSHQALAAPSAFYHSLMYFSLTRHRFYMSCFQLNVGGSGTAQPSVVNIPGAYGGKNELQMYSSIAQPLYIQHPTPVS